ncbi:MAG: hypothetical protein JW913_19775, partial [Chitinispirillaceae bacterium]|nr:hypothetical protein [Chitinispirillaceae bacterium]
MEKVFPGAVFTPIVQAPREQERELVNRVIACLTNLAPEGAPLADIATELETALARATESQEELEKSIPEESRGKALEGQGVCGKVQCRVPPGLWRTRPRKGEQAVLPSPVCVSLNFHRGVFPTIFFNISLKFLSSADRRT